MPTTEGDKPPTLFVSYNHQDAAEVEAVVAELRSEAIEVLFDRSSFELGIPWRDEAERALRSCSAVVVFLGRSGIGPEQKQERDMALSRASRENGFRVIPVLLQGADPPGDFLGERTGVDLANARDRGAAIRAIAAAVRREPPSAEQTRLAKEAREAICPYRGLKHFREEDASLFFGRETYTDDLVRKVRDHSIVVVEGASGRGKSSIVRAGLIPFLRNDPSGTSWDIAVMTPRDRPIYYLAEALLPIREDIRDGVAFDSKAEDLSKLLRERKEKLRDVADHALARRGTAGRRLLVVVDQWEELYTLCERDAERADFIEMLLDAAANGPVQVVLTVRADFAGRLADQRDLNDRTNDARLSLASMNRDELKRVIAEPARVAGLTLAQGLAERILDEVGSDADSLPLLGFTLEELWRLRKDSTLTHAAYEKMGGVKGSITHHADAVLASLGKDDRERLRRLFLNHLVRPGDRTEDTSRRAALAQLDPPMLSLARKLADERLVVISREKAAGSETVQVVHETLIRGWKTLKDWLDADREFSSWRERLRRAMADWVDRGRRDVALLRDDDLADARRWLERRREDLSAGEQGYIEASARRERRTRVRRWSSAAAIAAMLVAAGGIAWWSETRRVEARKQELCSDVKGTSDPWTVVGMLREAKRDLTDDSYRGIVTCVLERKEPWTSFESLPDDLPAEAIFDAVELMLPSAKPSDVDHVELIASLLWALDYSRPLDGRLDEEYRRLRETTETTLHEAFGVPPAGLIPADAWGTAIGGRSFRMGSEAGDQEADGDERPAPDVTLSRFEILSHEVTEAEWRAFAKGVPDLSETGLKHGDDLPVVRVTWYQAYTFAAWLVPGGRLPTEAEWDFAARGGLEGKRYPWGNEEACDGARCRANVRGAQIGDRVSFRDERFTVNGYGMYHTAGNVWEWVADRDGPDSESRPLDARGFSQPPAYPRGARRVFRGGSFLNEGRNARCASRGVRNPRNWFWYVGFRVVRPAAPSD